MDALKARVENAEMNHDTTKVIRACSFPLTQGVIL